LLLAYSEQVLVLQFSYKKLNHSKQPQNHEEKLLSIRSYRGKRLFFSLFFVIDSPTSLYINSVLVRCLTHHWHVGYQQSLGLLLFEDVAKTVIEKMCYYQSMVRILGYSFRSAKHPFVPCGQGSTSQNQVSILIRLVLLGRMFSCSKNILIFSLSCIKTTDMHHRA